MKFSFAFFVLSIFVLPSLAQADSVVSSSLGDFPASVNLNNYAGWAYYADTGASEFGGANSSPTTDANNVASFSAITPSGDLLSDNEAVNLPVNYTGGVGGDNPTSATGAHDYEFSDNGGLTLTTKLISSTETLNFFLYAYAGSTDISIALDGGEPDVLYADQTLTQTGPQGVNSGNTQNELTVTVQGTIGDLLSFNISPGSGGAHVGIEAVTVPEPSTYAMMLGSLALLGYGLRRKLALSSRLAR